MGLYYILVCYNSFLIVYYFVDRMNVAITRAKELMVVVGNGALLQRDPYWKSFLQFALRNGL